VGGMSALLANPDCEMDVGMGPDGKE